MEKTKQAIKNAFRNGWRLLCSPFVGAWDECRAAMNRPRAANWKEFVINDVRAYFAPLTGAVRGLMRTFKDIWHTV